MPTNVQEDSNYIYQSGGYKLIKAHTDHIEVIASSMREIDKYECACMGRYPKESLQNAFKADDLTLSVIDKDNKPIAMFGVGQVQNMTYIWLLGTNEVENASYTFLKYSRKISQALIKPYKAAFNFVHVDNHVAIKWLKFCGATFIRKLYFRNQPFYEFIITYKNYV